MIRLVSLAAGLVALATTARGDDAITPETVEAVKKATVFVRVEGDDWAATGSGFVVAADDNRALVATNHHVIAPDRRPGPRRGTVTVVFDSGTKAERTYPAAVAAADPVRDLAVLRVDRLKPAPRPLTPVDRAKLYETMPVYTFGFPFGKALATTPAGSPAVTVGRAHVSSLRDGPDGTLDTVQIDGNLNPGNSGGPVVDAKGGVVGVAVATLRDGRGIGFAVPGVDLAKLLRGRVGRVTATPRKHAGETVSVRIEAELIDPADRLTTAVAHYVILPPGAKRPDPGSADRPTGGKSVGLTIRTGTAAAEITVPAAEGEIVLRVEAAAADRPAETTPWRAFRLAAGPSAAALAGPPPAGWKEYAPADRAFVMWVPDKPARQAVEDREVVVGGQPVHFRAVTGTTATGLAYEGQSAALPAALAALPAAEVQEFFRGVIAAEVGGRVTDTRDAAAGPLAGVEYVVTSRTATARVRVYAAAGRVYCVSVRGPASLASGADAETILGAYRPPPRPATGRPEAAVGPKAKSPVVVGGNGPLFGGAPFVKDVAPPGGLLIGFEVVIARPFRDELVRAVRPIYRVGGVETPGEQFGKATGDPVEVKAKPGYAVGGITAKARNVCDGFSVTFMKVVGGKLDPTDRYESPWLGWDGGVRAVRVEGDGTPVVGFVGRANDRDVTGIGILFRGQEGFDPAAATRGQGCTDPVVLGGGRDPQFKEVAPAGGLLVGFEVGTARAYGREMTRSLRPIYRTGDRETFGEQRGTQLQNVTAVKAKPGYAVGAVSVMHGLGFDGLSVTFMRVTGDKLDPSDSYQSGYVGSDERKPLTRLGGDGTPAVGIVGTTNARDLSGFGLLFKGQEGFQPKER